MNQDTKKDSFNEEIIELTDVVEEPSQAASFKEPGGGKKKKDEEESDWRELYPEQEGRSIQQNGYSELDDNLDSFFAELDEPKEGRQKENFDSMENLSAGTPARDQLHFQETSEEESSQDLEHQIQDWFSEFASDEKTDANYQADTDSDKSEEKAFDLSDLFPDDEQSGESFDQLSRDKSASPDKTDPVSPVKGFEEDDEELDSEEIDLDSIFSQLEKEQEEQDSIQDEMRLDSGDISQTTGSDLSKQDAGEEMKEEPEEQKEDLENLLSFEEEDEALLQEIQGQQEDAAPESDFQDQAVTADLEKEMADLKNRLQSLEQRFSTQDSNSLEQRITDILHQDQYQSWWREMEKKIEETLKNDLESEIQSRIQQLKEEIMQEISSSKSEDGRIESIQSEMEQLKETFLTQEKLQEWSDNLKQEISREISQTVPSAAARIIREEIKALENELQD